MIVFVPLALLSWFVVSLVLFTRMPKQHAIVAMFVAGMLFLPVIHRSPQVPEAPLPISLPGIKLTKLNTISYAALFAVFLFDRKRSLSFRPRWFDLPALVYCVCPLFSSLTNELGLYDGISEVLEQTFIWGMPYFIGRIYLGDSAGVRALAIGIVLGGLVYVPLCLLEMRLSPQLHIWLYGFHQHDFRQTIRFDGYRPVVFLGHGLAVGLWMTAATLVAFWLYWTSAVPRLPKLLGRPPMPMVGALIILFLTTVLCRSIGALAIGMDGFLVLVLSRRFQGRAAMIALLMIAPLYIALRTSSAWSGENLVAWIQANIDADRAQSLEFRFDNEDLMIERALQRPAFGWGGWGRMRVFTQAEGEATSVTDGMWIIALGQQGWLGLFALSLTILLPAVRFTWLYPPRRWSEPGLAPAAVIAVLLCIVMIDGLLNDMVNAVFILGAGALAGLTSRKVAPTAGAPPATIQRAEAGSAPGRPITVSFCGAQ